MTYTMRILTLTAAVLLSTGGALAQSRHTPNTLTLTSGTRPAATIQDMAWLAGSWHGEALGGFNEEVWAPPLGGTMMGMYKLIRDGEIVFYELLTFVEEENTLVLKLKHFNADLTGWEERDEVRTFPLVRIEPDAAYFEGMTFERLGDDSVRVYVAIQFEDGNVREEAFAYRRVKP